MNQKGFTLIELMATLLIISVVMAITIPNVTGIFSQGKTTTYAEDAKKLKSTAEYMIRSNNSEIKPTVDGECVLVSLKSLQEEDEYHPPYGGIYLDTQSFVIMKVHNKRYEFYVQLIEQMPNAGGYRGFKVINVLELDDGKYFDNVGEFATDGEFVDVSGYVATPDSILTTSNLSGVGCTSMIKIYV